MASVAQNVMSDNDDLNEVITNPNELTGRIAQWRAKGFHVLSPAIKFTSFAEHFGASIAALIISTDESAGECYYDQAAMKQDERAISRVGLDKIAQLAGLSWLPSSRRTDPRTLQNLWEYHVDAAYVSYDGTPQMISGTSEVDLRDGSAQIGEWTPAKWRELLERNRTAAEKDRVWAINGWSEKRVMSARRFGLRMAESKAKNAAVRTLGLKGKYSLDELSRPFIVIRFQYIPDMSDDVTRRMVTEASMRGVSSLFAHTTRALPDATGGDLIEFPARREPIAVGASSMSPRVEPTPATAPSVTSAEPLRTASVQAQTSTPAVASTPSQPAAPLVPAQSETPAAAGVSPANFIREVKRETKTYGASHAKAGQTFVKYHVIDGNGEEHITIKSTLGAQAEHYWKEQGPVVITSVANRFNEREIQSLKPLTSVPSATEMKL